MTQHYALTDDGQVAVEPTLLAELSVGDTVLGLPDPQNPDAPRTSYVVAQPLGMHHVPTEDPTFAEKFLIGVGLERAVAGAKVEGVLLDGPAGPAMFVLEYTQVVDRVVK